MRASYAFYQRLAGSAAKPGNGRLDALEVDLVRIALERTRGNQTRAAELLGLSRFGLQKMIRRLDIGIPSASALRDDGGAVSDER